MEKRKIFFFSLFFFYFVFSYLSSTMGQYVRHSASVLGRLQGKSKTPKGRLDSHCLTPTKDGRKIPGAKALGIV